MLLNGLPGATLSFGKFQCQRDGVEHLSAVLHPKKLARTWLAADRASGKSSAE